MIKRPLAKALWALGLAIPLAAVVTFYLAVESEPMVRRSAEITPANAKRARQIIDQNTSGRASARPVSSLTISQEDLDLAANYLAHYYANGSARVSLQQDRADIAASLRPPWSPVIFYFNITGVLFQDSEGARFKQMTVGRVLIPGRMADRLFLFTLHRFLGQETFDTVSRNIKRIELRPAHLAMAYAEPSPAREKQERAAISADDEERLRAYQERLSLIGAGSKDRKISLTQPLIALFELAQARSKQSDAAAESRAALLVLAFHAAGKPLSAHLQGAREWPKAGDLTVTLHGRKDLAKHFLLAAALAAGGAGSPAGALGIGKETEEPQSASGYPLGDIAASRAGARFGARAADRPRASKLQQLIAAGVEESQLMPNPRDFPENFLPEAEFKRRFGPVGAPDYNRLLGEIDQRIAASSLYR